jgi:phosphoribosyl-AMP cyclohydrolase
VPDPVPSEPTGGSRSAAPGGLAPAELAELVGGLKFDAQGLVTAVIQDHADATVLMVGWMDAEAVRRTLTTGRTWFWSRSRREYWQKGETSGHRQYVRSVHADCDRDTLLVRVEQIGAACHTGARSCFNEVLPAVIGSFRSTDQASADPGRPGLGPGRPEPGRPGPEESPVPSGVRGETRP